MADKGVLISVLQGGKMMKILINIHVLAITHTCSSRAIDDCNASSANTVMRSVLGRLGHRYNSANVFLDLKGDHPRSQKM